MLNLLIVNNWNFLFLMLKSYFKNSCLFVVNYQGKDMAKEIKLPKLGETMEEGTIVQCLVKAGQFVKKGDFLFEIETDKATFQMESPEEGFVKAILAQPDEEFLRCIAERVLAHPHPTLTPRRARGTRIPCRGCSAGTAFRNSAEGRRQGGIAEKQC